MPERTSVPGVDEDLDLLFAQVDALREMPSEPDDARVYDFSVRWGTLLSGRLERLRHYEDGSRLTPEQSDRYAKLRSQLHEMVPVIERLGLMKPRVRLEP
jgi:hypothetical protein